MKFKIQFLITIVIILIFSGCNFHKEAIVSNLELSQEKENIILEYLDKNTDNIASASRGKMYSAFKLLGTNENKLYILMVKVEYFKVNNEIESRNTVSIPMVLKVKNSESSFSIINHYYPRDGKDYGKDVQKMFPSNIKFPEYDEELKLIQKTKERAEKTQN